MNKLSYITEHRVLLDGRQIGTIKELYAEIGGNVTGYRYFPKGDPKGGDIYPTLAACKQSLKS